MGNVPTAVLALDAARRGRLLDAILRQTTATTLQDWQAARRALREGLRLCELAVSRLEVAST